MRQGKEKLKDIRRRGNNCPHLYSMGWIVVPLLMGNKYQGSSWGDIQINHIPLLLFVSLSFSLYLSHSIFHQPLLILNLRTNQPPTTHPSSIPLSLSHPIPLSPYPSHILPLSHPIPLSLCPSLTLSTLSPCPLSPSFSTYPSLKLCPSPNLSLYFTLFLPLCESISHCIFL